MRIIDHILTGDDPLLAPFAMAANVDEVISPELVVLHETAGPLEAGSSRAFLARSDKVSVHFGIERDGTVWQQAPTNRACDHAGRSHYHGRDGVNAFSIGIELVGPGRMTEARQGFARTWWGDVLSLHHPRRPDETIVAAETPEHGPGLWMPFAEAQIGSLLALLHVLVRDVPTLRDIRGHWYVSPGRKIDPNPTLDVEAIRALVLGRTDPADAEAERLSAPPPMEAGAIVTRTPGDTLSLRRWPSFNPNVLARIPDGTPLDVERSGRFEGRTWCRVRYGGHEGWVVARYTEPAPRGT